MGKQRRRREAGHLRTLLRSPRRSVLGLSKHAKLVEAVGLLCVLLSWGQSYFVADSWKQGFEAISAGSDAFISSLTFAQMRIDVNMSSKLQLWSTTSENSQAWEDEEVRKAWMADLENILRHQAKLVEIARDFNADYALGFDRNIQLSDSRTALQKVVLTFGSGVKFNDSGGNPPPTSAALTADAATKLTRAFWEGLKVDIEIVRQVADTLLDRWLSESKRYAWLFLVGSILIVSAKGLEWRADRARE